MSCPVKRSRSGCCRTRACNSDTNSLDSPRFRSASRRASVASSRSSSRRVISSRANESNMKSSKARPRHNPSASLSVADAKVGSVSTAARPSVTNRSKCMASVASWSMLSRYPEPRVSTIVPSVRGGRSGSRLFRRPETATHKAFRLPTASSPHSAWMI